VKGSGGAVAWMTFTLEVGSTGGLAKVLAQVAQIAGVRSVRRK
jgi:(p)ppGpp synthase/HD superfamily hydrolase